MRVGRSRRSRVGGGAAARTMAILVAVGCCLAGAAYAATRPADPDGGDRTPLQPRFLERPDPVTAEKVAEFDFAQPQRPAGKARPGLPLIYECRLDDGPWEECEGPVSLSGIGPGNHRFAVRAVNHSGTASPTASIEWRRTRAAKSAPAAEPTATPSAADETPATEPSPDLPVVPPVEPPVEPVEPPSGLPFTIEQVGRLDDLFPGGPAQPIELRVDNPNPVPISVVSLTAAVAEDPPGCAAAENFVLIAATVSPATPLVIAAEDSATLPAAGIEAPTIAMLELPRSQDACQAAELTIDLEGEASG
jgi:hypothetical protein